jgi:hypothetical protein
VKLLPRRSSPAAPATDDHAEATPSSAGKGRPTPKRRDRVVQRGPVTAPKTRKEAYARQREQAKAAKTARSTPPEKMTAQQRRMALKAGDPAVLPRRDQGPTRKLARDYVDAHRMFSNYLLWVFVLLVISLRVPLVEAVVLAAAIAAVVEWYLVGRRIRALAIARYGSAEGSAMSIGFYAGSRAYLPRRWRLPGPQHQLGDEI